MTATRSRGENKELEYTIRVNGRVWAAFRNYARAREEVFAQATGTRYAEIIDHDGDQLLRVGSDALFPCAGCGEMLSRQSQHPGCVYAQGELTDR